MKMPVFTLVPHRITRFAMKALMLLAAFFQLSNNGHAFVLTCPQDYTIQLPPGNCAVAVNFDTLTWSNSVPLVDTVFFPPTGTFLETGITTVFLGVTDVNGLYSFCSFNVTVLASNSTALQCPATVGLSLNGLCERDVTAADILGGGATVCAGDYLVQQIFPNGGAPLTATINAFDIGQTLTIRVINQETFATCETEATVTGGTPTAISCPSDLTIFCNQPVDSSFTGVPEITGCYEEVDISFTDEIVTVLCPDSFAYQITRTWVSVDPFGKENACEQFITGKRYDINLVEFPENLDGISNPPLVCNDTLSLEALTDPDITGAPLFEGQRANIGTGCRVAVSFLDYETQLCGASYQIERVWSVVRLCAPSFTLQDTQLIVVLDTVAPVFEIPDTIFISLSPDCADSIFLPAPVNVVECSGFEITIETPWDTLVNGENLLFFQDTTGSYPVLYRLTDECGNTAERGATILIQNQPSVICPPDLTVSCGFYLDTLAVALANDNFQIISLLGSPVYPGNCEFEVTEVDSFAVSNCGQGFVQRSMTNGAAENPVTCIQNISVVHISDFEVQFPADTSVCGLPVPAVAGQPIITGDDCENVAFTFSNQTIQSGFPGCYTVLRTWEVVNACVFNGNTGIADPETGERTFMDGGDGYISFVQTIEVNNQATPVFPAGCELPDVFLGAGNCSAMLTLTPPEVQGCGTDISLTMSGGLGTNPGSLVAVEPGIYNVNWQAVDPCGNTGTCTTSFEVFDAIAPVAGCLPQVTVELTQNGTIQVFAADFNNNSTDNCGANALNFSFSTNTGDQSMTFQCCIDEGPNPLTIWVTDEAGNQSNCNTSVIVQSNLNPCDCGAVLSGLVETELNTGINKVALHFTGSSGFQSTVVTGTSGMYSLDVPQDDEYTITPVKDTLPLNGVTTFDAVLLTRHILGSQLLNSPYKIIAADVNNSGSVTTFDAVVMRRLILGIITEFPDNTSWRFVDADYSFINPANPFLEDFPEFIQVNHLGADLHGLNFIGLKVGDLNHSASPVLVNDGVEER